MRLQTLSGSTKKRDRPSDQPSNSSEEDGSQTPPDTIRTPSSLSIKVEGGGGPGMIRPPPSQKSKDTYSSKRQSRTSSRKHSASRSGINEVDSQFLSNDPQQQGDGKSNFNNKRNHDPDDLGYRKNKSKTKPNSNKSNGSHNSYASSNHLGKMNDGQIPVISWLVILSLLGLAFYHIRKAFIADRASSKRKGKDRSVMLKHPEPHGKKGRRSNRHDEDQEDIIHVESLLKTETVNKKKHFTKPKRSVTKKSLQDTPSPKLVEEKVSGGESPDSASTDGSSSGSAVKSDKDDTKATIIQVPLVDKSLESNVVALPRVMNEQQQPLDDGEWYQAKSRANRKSRKTSLGLSSEDDGDTTKPPTAPHGNVHDNGLESSPPLLMDSIDDAKTGIPMESIHIAAESHVVASDGKNGVDVEDFSKEEEGDVDATTVNITGEISSTCIEAKDSQPPNVVCQESVTTTQNEQHMPQDHHVNDSNSSSTSKCSSQVEDADRLLATLLQSQEEATALRQDKDNSSMKKESEWEEVSTKKKKRV